MDEQATTEAERAPEEAEKCLDPKTEVEEIAEAVEATKGEIEKSQTKLIGEYLDKYPHGLLQGADVVLEEASAKPTEAGTERSEAKAELAVAKRSEAKPAAATKAERRRARFGEGAAEKQKQSGDSAEKRRLQRLARFGEGVSCEMASL